MPVTLEAPAADDADWLALRCALWPEAPRGELAAEMANMLGRGHFVRVARFEDGTAAGFVEASKRNDYVNGTGTSPVAFLEGLFVVAVQRRCGIARALVSAVEKWALAAGCKEFASDSPFGNTESHAVHRRLGFEETERVVYFRKALRNP
jgi:aminoglycoside 6'-N-acetyltransferase I